MIPYIITSYGNISTFVIFIVAATLTMLFAIHISLSKSSDGESEKYYIFPKVITCGIIGYFTAGIFDAIFKYIKYQVFKISGITFFGGLIGAIIALYILLKCTTKNTKYNIREWFDLLTPPFILFHSIARIGCFFAGCCYGKATDSFLGVAFPDNNYNGIFHNGNKCYPTQLFESTALLLIYVLVLFSKHKFFNYLSCYAIARFFLEFLRGDDRGYIIKYLSPAQVISCCILILQLFYYIIKKGNKIFCIRKTS